MCYILCTTRPSVCVASGAREGHRGVEPPYPGGSQGVGAPLNRGLGVAPLIFFSFFTFVFSSFSAHGFHQWLSNFG
jgi:hypothetical protein